MIRGGTHYEFSFIPNPGFGGNAARRGPGRLVHDRVVRQVREEGRERRRAAADDALAQRRGRGRDRPEPRRQHVLVLLPLAARHRACRRRAVQVRGHPQPAAPGCRPTTAGPAATRTSTSPTPRTRSAPFLIHSPRPVSPAPGEEQDEPGRAAVAAFVPCRRGRAAFAFVAPAAGAASFSWIEGYDDPATPDRTTRSECSRRDRRLPRRSWSWRRGRPRAPPTSGRSRSDIVSRTHGLAGVVGGARENLLEDHSMVDRVKRGEATPQQLFDYYLGHLTNPSVTDTSSIPDTTCCSRARGACASRSRTCGGRRAGAAARREVVLGGHSLGGSITTAYATWDFNGRPGGDDLSGLVLIDGGSGPATLTAEEATERLQALQNSSPWLSFGGIPRPFAGLFNVVGSTFAKLAPNEPSTLQTLPVVPSSLKPPVAVDERGGLRLRARHRDVAADPRRRPGPCRPPRGQRHPRGWDQAGDISPIQRVADMFYGTGLSGLDGTAWYHPQRLTIDSGSGQRGDRQSGSGSARRPGDARPRPAAAADLRVRRRARRSAGAGCRPAARERIRDPAAQADAGGRKRDLRPRRSAVGLSAQRLREPPRAVPAEGQEGQASPSQDRARPDNSGAGTHERLLGRPVGLRTGIERILAAVRQRQPTILRTTLPNCLCSGPAL